MQPIEQNNQKNVRKDGSIIYPPEARFIMEQPAWLQNSINI